MPRFTLALLPILLTLIFSRTLAHQSYEEGYITADISNKGLEFIKEALTHKAESSLVPLALPKIENTVKVPILGSIQATLYNITVEKIHVSSSTLRTVDGELFIDVSGATANLSMNWEYEYDTWFLPISDKGTATVKVEGLEVALIIIPRNQQGSLKLSTLACACHVHEIDIELDGGASWLYQGFVGSFKGKIASAVEDAITEKLQGAVVSLDSFFESIPKQVQVTKVASLNLTLIDDPKLSESSLELVINGLFSAAGKGSLPSIDLESLQPLYACEGADKMVEISLHRDVLQSLSSIYFASNEMQWTVDKVPGVQSLLNTKEWRFIIPQLYKKYPNQDMSLNLTISSPPAIEVEDQRIKAAFPSELVVNVLNAEGLAMPVLCISMDVSSSMFAEITEGDYLAGLAKLNEFSVSLKWSTVGKLHTRLIQALVSSMLETIVLPYFNLKLSKGVKLPLFHGYKLSGARMVCSDSWIVICSDFVTSFE